MAFPLTIVGCGQVGANIAKCFQKSTNLKIMETSTIEGRGIRF